MKTHVSFRCIPSTFRRLSLASVALCIVFAAGSANAQWKVKDEDLIDAVGKQGTTGSDSVNGKLNDIKTRLGSEQGGSADVGGAGDINKRLQNLYKQQSLKDATKPEAYADPADVPTFDLLKDKPEGTTTAMGKDKRCGTTDLPCNLIFDTEMAKYNYSVAMYNNVTKKRLEEYKKIQEERTNIGKEDVGKLQSNSNRLLALLAKMEIDKQQHQMALNAYDARLHYLQTARDITSNKALNGDSSGLVSIIPAVTGALIMKTTLSSLDTVRGN